MVKRSHALVLVGFGFSVHANAGDICTSVHDTWCTGSDIFQFGPVQTHEECCTACKSYPGCNAWTWWWNEDKTCHLKKACGIPTKKYGYHSGVAGGWPTPVPTPPPTPWTPAGNICTSVHDMQCLDATFHDYGAVNTHQECCQACNALTGCNAWTWNWKEDRHCLLKKTCNNFKHQFGYHTGIRGVWPTPPPPAPTPPTPAPPPPTPGPPLQNLCNSIHDTQCGDATIKDHGYVGTHWECCQACENHVGCNAWTWAWETTRHCLLKASCLQAAPAYGYHSGIRAPTPAPTSWTPPGNICNSVHDRDCLDPTMTDGDVGFVSTHLECCQACNLKKGCNAWTWRWNEDHHCLLKSACNSPVIKYGYHSGIRGSWPTPPPSPVPALATDVVV